MRIGMKFLVLSALVASLAAAGCSGSSPTATPTHTPTLDPAPTPTSSPTATIEVRDSSAPTEAPPATETTVPSTPATTPAATEAPTLAPLSGAVSISIRSAQEEVRRGQEFSVDLMVDPRGRGISGVQLTIEYDPATLETLSVEPGPLLEGLSGPAIAEAGPNIRSAQGTLEYAAARIGLTVPPTLADRFATVTMRALETAAPGS